MCDLASTRGVSNVNLHKPLEIQSLHLRGKELQSSTPGAPGIYLDELFMQRVVPRMVYELSLRGWAQVVNSALIQVNHKVHDRLDQIMHNLPHFGLGWIAGEGVSWADSPFC